MESEESFEMRATAIAMFIAVTALTACSGGLPPDNSDKVKFHHRIPSK